MTPLRVAVVGDGVAACACAWGLVEEAKKERVVVDVKLFGTSSAGGGLAATRHPGRHGVEGLFVDYGPQVFHLSKENGKTRPLVEVLRKAGYLEEWTGTFGQTEASSPGSLVHDAAKTGLSEQSPFLSLRKPNLGEAVTRYRGIPGMWSLCSGILKLASQNAKLVAAGEDGGSAAGGGGNSLNMRQFNCQAFFSTRVAELMPAFFTPPREATATSTSSSGTSRTTATADAGRALGSWELFDGAKKSLGTFDWVVITDQPRVGWWSPKNYDFHNTDGGPLRKAAMAARVPELSEAVNRIGARIMNVPTTVVMLAWDLREKNEDAELVLEALKSLPFDITEVEGHDVLLAVVRQSLGPNYAVAVLYSTAKYSDTHKYVLGSDPSKTGVGTNRRDLGDKTEEEEVAHEICQSFEDLVQKTMVAKKGGGGAGRGTFSTSSSSESARYLVLPKPSWGPTVTRWFAGGMEEILPGGKQEQEGSVALFVPRDAAGRPRHTTLVTSSSLSQTSPFGSPALIFPEARVACAGSFMFPAQASVENAMRSGLDAAEQIVGRAMKKSSGGGADSAAKL